MDGRYWNDVTKDINWDLGDHVGSFENSILESQFYINHSYSIFLTGKSFVSTTGGAGRETVFSSRNCDRIFDSHV